MERVWLMVATLCLIAAALLLWRSQVDTGYLNAAFVAATLGVVAWFLRLRSQLRKTIAPADDVPAEAREDMDDQDQN